MRIEIGTFLHPRFDAIESFASGDASEIDRATVSRHLQNCLRCQDRLRDMRALRAAALDVHIPPMSPDLRERVLGRARSGRTGIIPVATESARPSPRRLQHIAVTLVAATIIGLIVLTPSRGLEAGPTAGTLSLTQKVPSPAPVIAVRYASASALGGSDRVLLKVATYVARKPYPPVEREFTLTRNGNGEFSGDVTLPEGTVFAQYTVTSVDGKHVDDNDARGWEAAVKDSASRPLFDGLWIQRILNGRDNWERAAAAASAMLEYYPDNPTGHRYAMYDARELVGAAKTDSIVRLNRPRIEALHRKFANAPLDATTMWEFAMVASDVRDTAMVTYWRQRMMREYPRDGGTIQQRVFAASEKRMPKADRLREFEHIWEETGGQGIQLLAEAFDLAVSTNDSATIARWGDRLASFGGGYEGTVSYEYATLPAFRARGAEMLRQSLRKLPPIPATDWRSALRNPSGRPVGQWQLGALGKALLDDGRVAAARDTLRRAAALGWDARTLRALGDAELAGGDTTAALLAYAWVVADRRTTALRADTVRAKLGAAAQSAKWEEAVADGRATLADQTMKSAIRRPFDANGSIADVSGARRTFSDVIGKRISIVAFVSRDCAPSRADLASLNAVAEKFALRNVPVVALVQETPTAEMVASLASLGFKGTVGFDDRAEASRRMRQSGTPHYFVVEDGNVIRFTARRAEDLPMLVAALEGRR
ncbi:MAG: hypothetical protein V4550_14920 [Gemmatimonadota bacterium]